MMPDHHPDPAPAASRRTHAAAALERALSALDAAETRQSPPEMVQALTQAARAYRGLAEPAAAETCLQRALGWAGLLGSVDASIDLLCELAEAAVAQAPSHDDAARARAARERARDHGFDAAERARHCADPQWELSVLLRVSDVLDRCGDHDDAIVLQCRAIALITHGSVATPAVRLQSATPAATM